MDMEWYISVAPLYINNIKENKPMYMNRNEMIDLYKKLMKGEVKTIKCLEPVFDLVERGARFDYNEDSIIFSTYS